MKTALFILIFNFYFLFSIEISVPKFVHSITCSDIDLDNDIDIIVGSNRCTSPHDSITILTNNGFGEFDKTSFERNSMHIMKCAKIDNDDLPDLITKVSNNFDIVYYKNYGDLTFDEGNIIHSTLSDHHEKIEIADMDNDGDNDVVFSLPYNGDYSYWGISFNNGNAQFSENVYYNSDDVIGKLCIGKINDDEFYDILLAKAYDELLFYNNLPSFEEVHIDTFPATNTYIFDMDNNGYNDLILFLHCYILDLPCDMKILYNYGNDIFVAGDTLNFPCGTYINDINDFNNDGFPDLVCTGGTWEATNENIYVYLNNTDGTFCEPDTIHIGLPRWFKIASADLDNNGHQDIVVSGYSSSNNNDAVRIFFNEGRAHFVEEPQASINDEELQITNYQLSNYPNPFNPKTTINYTIDKKSTVEISIYNIKGRLVKKLIDQILEGGKYNVIWDGKDQKNQYCSSGIYLVNLKMNGISKKTSKIILLK